MTGSDGPLLAVVRDRRIAFGMVGIVNTGIGYVVYALLIALFSVPYFLALVVAYAVAILCAFVLHRNLVFRVRGHVLRDLWRFTLVNLGAFLVNAALLPVFVGLLGMNPYLGQIAVAGVTMVATYIGHRDFSFHRKPAPAEEQL